MRFYASAIAFNLPSPFSNWLPTILSQSMNTVMSLAKNGWRPLIAHVTVVVLPFGASVNSTALCASMGLCMSSRMATRKDGAASVISMRPSPTLLLPLQVCAAPLPLSGPLYATLIAGSGSTNGFHVSVRHTKQTLSIAINEVPETAAASQFLDFPCLHQQFKGE